MAAVDPEDWQALRNGDIHIETGRVENPDSPVTVTLQVAHADRPTVILDSERIVDDEVEMKLVDASISSFTAEIEGGGGIAEPDPPDTLHYMAVSGTGLTDISDLARGVAEDVVEEAGGVTPNRVREIAREEAQFDAADWPQALEDPLVATLAVVGVGAAAGVGGGVLGARIGR